MEDTRAESGKREREGEAEAQQQLSTALNFLLLSLPCLPPALTFACHANNRAAASIVVVVVVLRLLWS